MASDAILMDECALRRGLLGPCAASYHEAAGY